MIFKLKDKYSGEAINVNTSKISCLDSCSSTFYCDDKELTDSWTKVNNDIAINESIDELFAYAFAMGYRRGSEETLEKLKWKVKEELK